MNTSAYQLSGPSEIGPRADGFHRLMDFIFDFVVYYFFYYLTTLIVTFLIGKDLCSANSRIAGIISSKSINITHNNEKDSESREMSSVKDINTEDFADYAPKRP